MAAPVLDNLPDLALIRPGRVHEATGPGRRTFAAALAGRLTGPVLWLQERRERDQLCPQGLARFFDPARLVLARPTGGRALLQIAEEALRSGAAPLVVAELAEAPDLTQSRRLQIAASANSGSQGSSRSGKRDGPRGLCLVPEGRVRSNAAETRWHCRPVPSGCGGDSRTRLLWELVKNKRGRLGCWEVILDDGTAPRPYAQSRQQESGGGLHAPRAHA